MSEGTATRPGKHSVTARQTARKEFDRWAGSYDRSWLNEIVFFPSIRACQEEIYRWQQARGGGPYRILDVGCGTGNQLSLLARDDDAEMLVGLDYSPVMVSQFAEKIRVSPAARERVHAVHGDSERLPFADASFDVLTCCNSFHHYPHQPAVIREFRRVLRPGGMALLIDGFRDNVVGWVVFDVIVTLAERDVHHAPWSSVRKWFQQAGLRDIRQRKMNVLAPLLITTGFAT
jgi:ubiquinone/menaquinone biosynthesis C-methylase UbiE